MNKICRSYKIPLFVLVLIIFFNTLYSQNNKQKFKTLYDKNHKYIIGVEFIDTTSNIEKKIFNFSENNPYNSLNLQSIKKDSKENNVYSISGIKLDEIELENFRFVLNKSLPDTLQLQNAEGFSSSGLLYNKENSNYIIVKYVFFIVEETSLIGQSTALFIFKSNGELIKVIDNFEKQCKNVCITEDGKYLAYTYGGVADESLDFFDSIGFQIMDIANNKVICDEQFDTPIYKAATGCFDNYIRVTLKSIQRNFTFIIYDFSKGFKYTKDYPVSVLGNRKAITDSGFLFEVPPRGSGKVRTDYYKTDFKVEKIK